MEENQDAAIAELRERVRCAEDGIARLDKVTAQLEGGMSELRTAVSDLRVAIARVATKDDVQVLRNDINSMFQRQLTDANNAIPAKIGLWLTGGTVVVMVLSLIISLIK